MKVNKIVVHCSDSPQGRGDNAATIHRWHKERGFDGIGYHAVILESGAIERGRPLYWSGAHTKGRNHDSIGICLIGEGVYTLAQLASLRAFIDDLLKEHEGAEVYSHNDLDPSKPCPYMNIRGWYYG